VSRVSFINYNLISYLSNGGGPNPDGTGGGSPSYFVSRRVMMISPVDIKISI
jgi:site-specific DNA recombinase